MTTIEIADGKLRLTVKGFDAILALKKHLEVPLQHVERAEVGIAGEMRERLRQSLRMPGTYLPGIVTAGSYLEHGRWMFWDVKGGDKAITLYVTHEKYDALVVDVENPEATVDKINVAVAMR